MCQSSAGRFGAIERGLRHHAQSGFLRRGRHCTNPSSRRLSCPFIVAAQVQPISREKHMSKNFLIAAVVLGVGLSAPAVAQHDHHEEQGAAPADKAAGAPAGGTMPCGMMAEREETAKIVDQLVKSFAAMESEKDPAALKTKLAAHGDLLKQLQRKTEGPSRPMDMMRGMKGKMGEATK
jgi:hypothetical protein